MEWEIALYLQNKNKNKTKQQFAYMTSCTDSSALTNFFLDKCQIKICIQKKGNESYSKRRYPPSIKQKLHKRLDIILQYQYSFSFSYLYHHSFAKQIKAKSHIWGSTLKKQVLRSREFVSAETFFQQELAERSTSVFAILSNESFMNKRIIKTTDNHGTSVKPSLLVGLRSRKSARQICLGRNDEPEATVPLYQCWCRDCSILHWMSLPITHWRTHYVTGNPPKVPKLPVLWKHQSPLMITTRYNFFSEQIYHTLAFFSEIFAFHQVAR